MMPQKRSFEVCSSLKCTVALIVGSVVDHTRKSNESESCFAMREKGKERKTNAPKVSRLELVVYNLV